VRSDAQRARRATDRRAGAACRRPPPARTGLARAFPATPPPGPFRRSAWRSPLRGPWLTSILGTLLLGGVVVVGLTVFHLHAAYAPSLG
jgi:hypothetical protein